ncbi:MAG: alpha,alpha-phosphotrehalase [Turicibacter sp.]|nr:alpha,alpha-phosphotrehalase [Turicibacter sp.]
MATTFKEKTVYQIYPKSFLDTTGNGIGDLNGIRKKLPYLADLGVEMLWLNPFYPSPQKDNGYDISDYTAIDPLFGTMDDFEALVKEAKAYGIGLMLDMVLNHVSTKHEWFQKALAGDKHYQDYFFIQDEITDWQSKFGGNAWSQFGDTGKYYLHLFDKTQADLCWRNPDVRNELFGVVNFWIEKGVEGFRFDVINLIGKDEILKSNPVNEGKPEYTDKPLTHDYLRELNEKTFGRHSHLVTVGEMSSTTIENCLLYTKPERKELSMTFNFHHLKVDYENGQKWTKKPFDFEALKTLFHNWGEQMSDGNGWNALFWNNHDQPRALNRFVDAKNYRVEGAKMLAAAIHLNRGTPYVYMGEEIGMLDPDYDDMSQYVDVESLNAYEAMLKDGLFGNAAFEIIQSKSRDNSRIPMQWDETAHAGFTTGTPWLAAGKTYPSINVEEEIRSGSIHAFYKQLIKLRKELPLVARGTYAAYLAGNPNVYGFTREHQGEKLLVLNNFYPVSAPMDIPEDFSKGAILVSNTGRDSLGDTVTLKPYETLAIHLKNE